MNTRNQPIPFLLKPRQVAHLLQIHRATVYRLINSGQLRAVKVGTRLRVPYTEVERLARGEECHAELAHWPGERDAGQP